MSEENTEILENIRDEEARARAYVTRADNLGEWRDGIANDLLFASGDQWDSEVVRKRKNRPTGVWNIVRPIVDRIVNPLRMSSIDGSVSFADAMVQQIANGLLKKISRSSKASEAYERALETAAICGYGYVKIAVEERKGKLRVVVKQIENPTRVIFDPHSTAVDGGDAMYVVLVSWISKNEAAKMGEEYCGESDYIDFARMEIPEDSVTDLELYERIGDRCRVTRIVGGKAYGESVYYNADRVLIVPCYGDRVWLEDPNQRYKGVVHKLRDNQIKLNFEQSNIMELVGKAPKSPIMVAKEAIEGFAQFYATANTEDHAYLPYNGMSSVGQPLPAPYRMDNTSQTQGLQGLVEQSLAMTARMSGVSDGVLFGQSGANQSGVAVDSLISTNELSTSQYIQNLTKTIEAVTYIVLQLSAEVYDYPMPIEVTDEMGETKIQMVVPAQVLTPDVLDLMEVEVQSGPAFESRRKENIAALQNVLMMVGPEKASLFADAILDEMDTPAAKMAAKRLRLMLPPELQEQKPTEANQPDPEAMAALEEAEATINELSTQTKYMEGIIASLQAQLEANEIKAEADVYKAELDAQVTLAKTQMEIQGRLDLELVKAGKEGAAQAMAHGQMLATQAQSMVDEVDEPQFIEQNEGPEMGGENEVMPQNEEDLFAQDLEGEAARLPMSVLEKQQPEDEIADSTIL